MVSIIQRENVYFNTSEKTKCDNLTVLFTWESIFVSIQSSELFAVVAAQRIPSIALVGAQPQAVAFALWLQVEAAVLSVNLLAHPVLQLH